MNTRIIVQIPCLNEEQSLPLVLESIPKTLPGVEIDVLIIDDGSSDRTVSVAKEHGVKHFVIHKKRMGLARSFHDGVNKALELGADIVVNTDGDNQYPSEKIGDLTQPIIDGRADIVIGDRQTSRIAHFSIFKKLMQRFGSWVVNKAAGTDLPDAASGFRAYSREAIYRLNIVTKFSYCMETIIQAGNKQLSITSIPIKTNQKTRESRLFKNIWQHMYQSMGAIVRSYLMYRPYMLFLSLAGVFAVLGSIPFLRYLYLVIAQSEGGHVQSLLLGTVLMTGALLSVALGVLADLIRINRILLENQLEISKRIAYSNEKSTK